MSGYVIREEDFWSLENTRDMADLLATGMGHLANSAEVVYPNQVEATARCLVRLIDRVLRHAHYDEQARNKDDATEA